MKWLLELDFGNEYLNRSLPLRDANPSGKRPQDVVPSDGTREGVSNHAGGCRWLIFQTVPTR